MSSEDGIEQTLALRMLNGVRARKRSTTDDGWVVTGTSSAVAPVVSADQPESFSEISAEVFEAPAAIAEVELTPAAIEEETVLVASTDEPQPLVVLAMSEGEVSEPVTEPEVAVAARAEAASDSWTPVLIAGGGSGSGAPPRRPVAASAPFGGSGDHGRSIVERSRAQERLAAHHGSSSGRGRRRGLKAGVASLATAAMVAGSAGIAFANAANPLPTSQGTAQVQPDGSVLVNLTGTWDWGDINGASPQSDCSKRYGVGWAVDWKDASVPYVITGKTTTGAPITFHVGSNYDGMDLNLCAAPNHPDADGSGPTGPWSATHTYPNVAAVPSQLCVNFYDPHGQENQPPGGTAWPAVNNIAPSSRNSNFVAGGPNADGDNSIQTNSFDPNQGGGFCFSPKFVPALTVAKSGPATGAPNGNGVYSIKVSNTGTGPSAPGSTVTDVLPTGETYVSDTGGCTPSGQTITCPAAGIPVNGSTTFKVTVSYGPNTAGQALTDCASAGASGCQGCAMVGTGAPCNNCQANTASCVTTKIVDVAVDKTNNAQDPAGTTFGKSEQAKSLGETFTYRAVITNNSLIAETLQSVTDSIGGAPATPVTCNNPSPIGTTQQPNGIWTCDFTGTAPNTTAATQTDLVTAVAVDFTNPSNTISATSTSTVTTQGAAQLTVAKSGPATGAPNGNGTYTLQVTNNGNGPTTATTVTDLLPTGETYVSDTDGCTPAGQVITCPVAAGLAVGGSTSFTVTVSYGPNTAGQALTDCASAGASACQGCATVGANSCNNCQVNPTSCVTTDIVDVSVDKTNNAQDPTGASFGKSEQAPTLGETFTYRAVITNNSLIPEILTSVTDSVGGAAATPVTCDNPSPIGTTQQPNGTWTCEFSGTAPNTASASLTDTVTARVVDAATQKNPISGTSTSTVTTPGATTLVVNVVKTNNAQDPAGATFGKVETAQTPGENFTYKAVISNPTSVDELISSLTDTVPTGSSNTSDVCHNFVGTTLPAGQSVTCTFTGTAPAANSSLEDTVTAKVTNVPGKPAGNATGTDTSTVNVAAQTLQGHIYLCSNNQPTTAEVTGGTISATGPQTLAAAPNPLNLIGVAAGTYSVNATAPSGYTFAICNGLGSAVEIPHSGSNTSQSVTVPVGGTGTAIFYVIPNTPGLSVSVVKTNNASDPTGTNFSKTQTAQSLGETFTYQAVISNTNTQPEVITSITDLLPGTTAATVCASLLNTTLQPGQSVTCQFPGTAPSTSGTSETDTVTVTTSNTPGNPTGTATGTDTSTVLTTPTVIITKANDANGDGTFTGSETASATATNVPYQVVVTNNNAAPGTITALTDTVNGTTMNICPDLVGTTLQPGQSATCNFTGPVPTSPTTDTAAVTLSVNGILVTATAPSTVFPPVLGTQITNNPPTTPVVAPTQLAFTGAPVKNLARWAGLLLLGGLALLAGLSITDPRRRRLALVDGGWARPSWDRGEASKAPARVSDLVSSGLAQASRMGRAVMGESRTDRLTRRYEGFRPSGEGASSNQDG